MTKHVLKFNTSFQKEPMDVGVQLYEASNESSSILYSKDVQLRVV